MKPLLWPTSSDQCDITELRVGRYARSACAQVSSFLNTTAFNTLASHKRPSVPSSTAPSSGPCLTFPFSHNDLPVASPIHHVFSCYIILFMLFPLTATPSPPPPSQILHLRGSSSSFKCSVQTEPFFSGKLALKSYEPGDSSRTRGQSVTQFSPCKRNGKNQTTFVYISKNEYNYQM